jgi:MmyB-like transcription regulator ligand binding domain
MELEGAGHALDLLLTHQEPYPAFLVDRYWNMLRMNAGTKRFHELFLGSEVFALGNPIRLVFDPRGLRPFIQNWEDLAARLIRRVHREAAANPCDEKMKAFLDELLSYPGVPARWRLLGFDGTAPPFLTIDYLWKRSTLRLFSMITRTTSSPKCRQDKALPSLIFGLAAKEITSTDSRQFSRMAVISPVWRRGWDAVPCCSATLIALVVAAMLDTGSPRRSRSRLT